MPAVCLYLQVHQPYRIKNYRVFDIGVDQKYFNSTDGDLDNSRVFQKVASKSYLPANQILLELLDKHPEFNLALSFSGVALEQMENFSTETLESFQKLVKTGRVEILAETYYHSLAFFYSPKEFHYQVKKHERKIYDLFGVKPRVFRNTELAYNDQLGAWAEKMGYIGVLAEGWEKVLDWRNPNFVYRPPKTNKISLLLKNYRLSDDIAFRFSERSWAGWPMTAEKFANWVNQVNGNGCVVNLFMDYETFGEHQWVETGIFDFLRSMPGQILNHPDNIFKTPSQVIADHQPVDVVSIKDILTWADTERDLSAWLGNKMQQTSIENLYQLEDVIHKTEDEDLIESWRKLQTSDHFYYMCTKWFADGDIHAYFSPYTSPYEAFMSFSNALHDLKFRAENVLQSGQYDDLAKDNN